MAQKPRRARSRNRARMSAPKQCCAEIPEATTGLRFYNPDSGRWLNRDPIGERGGLNLYAYVDNRTITQIDRLGLAPIRVSDAIVSGSMRINAIDKTFPSTDTYEFRTRWSPPVLRWKATGHLRIVGSNSDSTVRVSPTGSSRRRADSRIAVYRCIHGKFEWDYRRVTIYRPVRFTREEAIPRITARLLDHRFAWTLWDQFGDPLPNFPVRETVTEVMNHDWIDIDDQGSGSGPTRPDGTITDTYYASATSRDAVRTFHQRFRFGRNWYSQLGTTTWRFPTDESANLNLDPLPQLVLHIF